MFTIKTIPERYAATIHMTLPRYEDEGMIWGKLAEETCRMIMEGLDVYLPLVDDHGVDCIIKRENGTFIEIQIKQGREWWQKVMK
jgi:hypothetical protein